MLSMFVEKFLDISIPSLNPLLSRHDIFDHNLLESLVGAKPTRLPTKQSSRQSSRLPPRLPTR